MDKIRAATDVTTPLLAIDDSMGTTDVEELKLKRSISKTEEDFPPASWTWSRKDSKGRQLPQVIAHRGYKAVYPENTMAAFRGAVEVGTHAVETDIHLSKDDVVVLSHDPDLKRCFGEKTKIIDCEWSYLCQLKTTKAPHEPMPRLSDLLTYLATPPAQHIWLLLDIKLDNDADTVMRLISSTLSSIASGPPGSNPAPWTSRVVLGIWAAKFLPLCIKHCPGYPVSHIGFSTFYARQFLQVPNVSFNMLQRVLMSRMGRRFMRDVRNAKRPLYAWTVNDTNLMKWCVQNRMDGVITDDPKRFKAVCDDWREEVDGRPAAGRATWGQWLFNVWLWIMIMVFWIPFRRKFPETVAGMVISNQLKAKAQSKLGKYL